MAVATPERLEPGRNPQMLQQALAQRIYAAWVETHPQPRPPYQALSTAEKARWLKLSARLLPYLEEMKIGPKPGTAYSLHEATSRLSPVLVEEAGRRALEAGDALRAYDIFSEGLELLEANTQAKRRLQIRLRQQLALSLAQAGATSEAMAHLTALCQAGLQDGETLGILGRVLKDLGTRAADAESRRQYLKAAFEVYSRAYDRSRRARKTEQAYYTGINAATVALLLGRESQSQHLAGQVKRLCLRLRGRLAKQGQPIPYWLLATLGEAELLLRRFERAEAWYKSAAAGARHDHRALASMRRQARLILGCLHEPEHTLDACFGVPHVILFAGHMLDRPGQPAKRFPRALEGAVRKEIAARLARFETGIAYASAACGSDILFLEEVIRLGGEINVVLPFEREQFLRESVGFIREGGWAARFERVLEHAAQVKVLGQYHAGLESLNFEFTNLILYGLAKTRAKILDTELKALAVWDGVKNGQAGGTASAVSHWQRRGQPFERIDPLSLGRLPEIQPRAEAPQVARRPAALPANVRHHLFAAMLFADVKGYSRLSEPQLVQFSVHFLGRVAETIRPFEAEILSRRTQGDSLFLVFPDPRSAVRLALALQQDISQVDWTQYGLPADLQARISLDAGPCFSYQDPVVGQMEFCGNYVNRAARIEPITPPGHIYASESYVALARALGLEEVQFEYVGQVALPKDFGVVPVYHVESPKTAATAPLPPLGL